MLLLWIVVFVISLAILVVSADIFTKGAEMVGLKLRINPFIVGVTIVAIGTSLPELVTSLVAISVGDPSIVVANAIGSNIANILLIVGLAAIVAGIMRVERSLIDLDAPLLAISTAMLIIVLLDRQVTMSEAVVLLLTYVIYLAYTIKTGQSSDDEIDHEDRKIKKAVKEEVNGHDVNNLKMVLFLVLGAAGVYFGADWTIEAIRNGGPLLGVPSAVIAITAVAVGTSLPELVVSMQAARKGNYEIALGNVFGSNIFNSLVVVGVPGLFTRLPVDASTFTIGIIFLASATLLYVFSGISKHLHQWEGYMYLTLYGLFVLKVIAGAL